MNFSLVLRDCCAWPCLVFGLVFAGRVVIGWGMPCCYVTFTANAATHVYAFVLSTLIYRPSHPLESRDWVYLLSELAAGSLLRK